MTRAQTATEYLIILSIIIAISLITISVMQGIQGMGGTASQAADHNQLTSGDIAVMDYGVSDNATTLTIKNNYGRLIRIDGIIINNTQCLPLDNIGLRVGASSTIECPNITSDQDWVRWDITINWTDMETSTSRSSDIGTLTTAVGEQ